MILFRAINSGIFFMCIILLLNKQTNKLSVIHSIKHFIHLLLLLLIALLYVYITLVITARANHIYIFISLLHRG